MMVMDGVSEEAVVERTQGVVGCDIDEEVIVMSIENGEYYNFNKIASGIWRSLEEPKTINSLVYELTDKYKISTEECKKSVNNFIEKLKKEGLVTTT